MNSLAEKLRIGKEKYIVFNRDYPKAALALKLSVGLFTGIFGFIFGLWLLVILGAFGRLPSANDLKNIHNHTASEIYSADGKILGKYFIENRINVTYDEISPDIINALIATEDARFLEHSGIDLRSWARVFIKTILMRKQSAGGGSTLSQQLAKNLFPRQKYFVLTVPIIKIREMIIAKRLERAYSKDELINLYLNTVPFGSNMYGIQVAASQLFNTNSKDIEIQNAAVLVGMLKANTAYNPVKNPERSLERRNTVLNQMEKYGYLSKEALDSLKALPLELDYRRESNNEGLATYFREHLRLELDEFIQNYKKPDGEPYNLYTDGLKIYTTIHSKMQDFAEQAMTEQMEKLQKAFDNHWKNRKPWGNDEVIRKEMLESVRYKSLKSKGFTDQEIDTIFNTPINMTVFTWQGDEVKKLSPLDSIRYYYSLLNAGFLVMEPASGAIRAWVGGIDHQYFKYDHVKSTRQVGSVFKPIVYANALRSGIEPCEYFPNEQVVYTDYKDWSPRNADGVYGGAYSMTGALTGSVNTVSVGIIMQTSIDSVIELAREMGFTGRIPVEPAIALGTAEGSLLDLVRVYGTFSNRGVKPEPHYLTRIENAMGDTLALFEHSIPNKRVLPVEESDMMIRMMQTVVDSGTASRLRYIYGLYNDIAGKTGTTQSQADGWFLGFTPNLVAGAWVGGESPRVRFRSLSLGQGANTALPIWGLFMQKLYKDPEFKNLKYAKFPELSPEALERLDCPTFLEEMPEVQDSLENDGGLNFQIDRLFESIFKPNKDKNLNVKPDDPNRKPTEAEKRSAEIKKHNEKLEKKRERQKNRQNFWDKLRKKDN